MSASGDSGEIRVPPAAGWLLVLASVGFAGLALAEAITLSKAGIVLDASITPDQMTGLAAGWIGSRLLSALAIGIGSLGLYLVASTLARTSARVWGRSAQALAALAVATAFVAALPSLTLVTFTEAHLSENVLFQFTLAVGTLCTVASIGAVICVGVGLVTAPLRRILGGVLVGGGLLLLGASLSNLPVPPFTIPFLWLALGIAVLLRPAHAEGVSAQKLVL